MNRTSFLNGVLSRVLVFVIIFSSTQIHVFANSEIDLFFGSTEIASGQNVLKHGFTANTKAMNTSLYDASGDNLSSVRFIAENYQQNVEAGRWTAIFLQLSNGETLGVRTRRGTAGNADRLAIGYGTRPSMLDNNDAGGVAIGETAPGNVFFADGGGEVNTRFPSFNPSNTPLNANIFVIDASIINDELSFTVAINNDLPVSGTVSGLSGVTIDSIHAWSHGTNNNDPTNTLHLPNWLLLDTTVDEHDDNSAGGDTLIPNRQLLADGTATRDNQGTSVAPATTLLANAPVGLMHAEFNVKSYQTLRATNRWSSIFIELSNGKHIIARTRRTSGSNPTFDRMGVRIGGRQEAINGGDIATGNVFLASNAGAVVSRFVNIHTPSGALATANEFRLTVDITPEGALVYEFFVNGEQGTEPVVGTAQLPAGTTILSVHAWGHTNSTLHIPTWELWDTTPRLELTEPPEGIPVVTASVGVTGQVGLSWNAIESAQQYLISYRQLPSGTESAPVNVGNLLTHTFTGLTDGIEYDFFVRAANEVGEAIERGRITATPTVVTELLNLRYGTWNETIYAQWDARIGDTGFDVYISANGENNWSQVNAGVHAPLVRVIDSDANTWRVDVPGLRALADDGYDLRIVSLPSEVEVILTNLIPTPYMRTGAAFEEGGVPGGYDLDGTPKAGAQFIYVTHENMNDVLNNALLRGQNVNNQNTTPTIVRFVGTVGQWTETNLSRPDPGVPSIANANNMVQAQWRQNITFEGIGPDAVIYGWGLQLTDSTNVEVRNLTFHYPFEDGVWIQRATHAWVHHNTFTHGQDQHAAGGESDKARGDGASDVVNSTRFWTLGFNHYIETDKTMLVGGNNNIKDAVGRGTIHHNFFDRTHSRHPRVRFAQVHVFNNVYIKTTGYGIGAGSFARIVAEGNYFQDANRPIIMHGQGNAGVTMGQDASGVVITDLAPGMTGLIEPNIFNHVRNFNPTTDLTLERLPNDAFRSPITNTRRYPENSNGINGTIATAFYEVQLWPLDQSQVQTATNAHVDVVAYAGVMAGINYTAAPTVPVITQAVINENETFTINWTALAEARRYILEWDQGDGTWVELVNTSIASYTTTVNATENGTYAFRVAAKNSMGVSSTSDVMTISYLTPYAPTNLVIDEGMVSATFNLSWTAPVKTPSSYVVRLTQQFDQQGNVVTGQVINEVSVGTEFMTDQLAVGTWQVEIFARNGQLLSEPLTGELLVTPWYIYIDDLNHLVLSEDFANLPVGPIRGDLIERFNPAILRHPAGILTNHRGLNFTPTVGIHTASAPVMVEMTGYNNDVLITANGQKEENSLKLQDFSPGNNPYAGGEEVQHGTFIFIDLEEEITEGRVVVEMDYRVLRSTTGNGMTPIRLYDGGGRQILNRSIAQGEGQLTEGTQAGIALPGNYGPWRNVRVALDFDASRYDIYFENERIVTGGELPANVTGLKTLSANTPTGNQGGNPSQLSLYIDNISVRTPEVNLEPLPTPYPEDLGLVSDTWFETAYALWTGDVAGGYRTFVRLTPGYNAYYWRDGSEINMTDSTWDMAIGWVEVDPELIRLVDGERGIWRVDILGLPEGTYDVYVINSNNDVIAAFGALETVAFPRYGAAFVPGHELISNAGFHDDAPYGATGGYLSDGRIDPEAVMMYISHGDWDDFNQANLVQNSAYRGGNPLVVRFLGTVGAGGHRHDLTHPAMAELPPLVIEGPNAQTTDNGRLGHLLNGSHRITFEGIGPDAGIYGWGLMTGPAGNGSQGSNNIVIRNLSMDGYFSFGFRADGNSRNVWMHHNDLGYGANWFLFADGETDRSMGRGAMDAGQHVSGYTFSYNHIRGGRGTHLVVGGVQNANLANDIHRHIGTIHHNLYESAQERNPRTRHHNLHIFNNLYQNILGHPLHYRLSDRHTGYGQGAAHNAIIWSEGNLFEDVGFPMQRSRHGHARGYYPHTGHNHFFGDGPGFMVTNDNRLLDGTSLGAMPFPAFGDWGYRNRVTGLDTPLQYADFKVAVRQLEPNVMDVATASTFDPMVDTGMTVNEEATMMVSPPLDPAALGFPALNGNAHTHGWGFQGDFRPFIERDQVMSTETPAQIKELREYILENVGRMPTLPEILMEAPVVTPTNVQVNFNELDFIMHRHDSPMGSLRKVAFPHTFTIEWDRHADSFAECFEIQYEDGGTWRTLGFVDNNDRPNRFSTDSLHDHGYLQLSSADHDWVATDWGGNGLSVLYPNTKIGHSEHPLYAAADIPATDDLIWPADWVIADVINGGTYRFRIRAVNRHGVSDWTNANYVVADNHSSIQDIVQLTPIVIDENEGLAPGEFPIIDSGLVVEFEVITNGIEDGIYDMALSVPRSLPRREFPWITRSMRGEIYLEGTDLASLPEENTESRAPYGFSQLGNGGVGTIEIMGGVGTIEVVFDADTMPFDLLDLVLTLTIGDTEISLPFAPNTQGVPIQVRGIQIDQDDMELAVGESYELTFTIDPTDATHQNVDWSSSDEEVVNVDENGKITSFSVGIATIRVTTKCGNYYDEIVITVVAPIISLSIYYDGELAEDFTLYLPDGRRQLEARVKPIHTNESYEWISSDEDVVTVNEDGLVMAGSQGEATIYLRTVTPASRLSVISDFVVVTVEGKPNPDLDAALATLQALIDYASGLDGSDFTSESWALLQSVLDLARLTLNTNDLDLVEAMIVSLNAAIEALVEEGVVIQPSPALILARETLAELIEYVDRLNGADFTENSWTLLLIARHMAVLTLESDSVDMVNSAIVALRAALNALEKISDNGISPQLPICPDAQDCKEGDEVTDDQQKPDATIPARPTLPQTGAIVSLLSVVGLIIFGAGLAISKMKKNCE